jgi:hypothetical protein
LYWANSFLAKAAQGSRENTEYRNKAANLTNWLDLNLPEPQFSINKMEEWDQVSGFSNCELQTSLW